MNSTRALLFFNFVFYTIVFPIAGFAASGKAVIPSFYFYEASSSSKVYQYYNISNITNELITVSGVRLVFCMYHF